MSLFCPSDLCPCLFVSLPSSYCIYQKRGSLSPVHLRKNTFCDFSNLCFSLLRYCAEVHDGGGANNFVCIKSTLFITMDQFQQGFMRRERGGGGREQDQDSNTFLCFYLTFNDHDVETCWRQSSGCWLLCSLEWFGFFLRMTNSWRGPMIECVWLSLATPSSPIDGLQWECVGRLQMEVFFLRKLMPLWGSCCEGYHVALKHRSFHWWFEIKMAEFAADNELSHGFSASVLFSVAFGQCVQT